MSGLPMNLSKQKKDIIKATAVPPKDGDFVWNGKDEDDRPLTKQEMYESIRRPLKFDQMLKKVQDIKSIKEQHNSHKPVIKIQSIWPAIKDNPTVYYETFAPYVDLIAFNPLIDYLSKDEDISYEDDFSKR